jgi:phosphoglycolate phosphatase
LKHLIWDLDGTLVDSQADILHYLELALRDVSLDMRAQVKPVRIGPPLDVILRESFPIEILTEEMMRKVISSYRTRYNNSGFPMTAPFGGIDDIISDTVNFVHHVVTNKPNPASSHIIEKVGWAGKITSLKAQSARIEEKRSKSELFAELIAEFGDGSQFIGIGDVKTDGAAAKNNNITAVGVLWGSGTREELADCCDHVFENTAQLRGFLYNGGAE